MRLSHILPEDADFFDNVSKGDANLLVQWWNAHDLKHRYYREGFRDSRGRVRWRVKRDVIVTEERARVLHGHFYCPQCGITGCNFDFAKPIEGIGGRDTGGWEIGTTDEEEQHYVVCLGCGRVIQRTDPFEVVGRMVIPEGVERWRARGRTFCACGKATREDFRWVSPMRGIGERITGWVYGGGKNEEPQIYIGCLKCGRIMYYEGDPTSPLEVIDRINPEGILYSAP